MKHPDQHDLPPCPLSTHCLRMVDEIDHPRISQQLDVFSFTDDIRDERLLEQLRSHVPDCPTCTAALAEARQMRQRQRTMLRDFLAERERVAPSVAEQILAAIRREQRDQRNGQQANVDEMNNHHQRLVILPRWRRRNAKQQSTGESRSRILLRNVLAVAAVVVIILASFALFAHHFLTKVAHVGTPTVSPGVPAIGWSSVVMAVPGSDGSGSISIVNYDPVSRKHMPLVPSCCPSGTIIDGVSHDGHNLLYHTYANGKTHYRLLSGEIYVADGQVGNAVWTTDDRSVLIAASNSVVQVDVKSGAPKTVVSALNTASVMPLTFYRNGFLYFTRVESRVAGGLYRVNLSSGVEQKVAEGRPDTTYWLSPDGSTVYYTARSGGGKSIYAVNSDGSNFRHLRSDGMPIGYAADSSLMILRQRASKYEVVKLGATPRQDQVKFADAAPKAVDIPDGGAALAPFGYALVLEAVKSDGYTDVWFDDLATGKQQLLMTHLNKASTVQLVGWDRIPVSSGTSTPLPTVAPSSTATATPPGSDWNAVAIAIPSDSSLGLWSITNNNYLNGNSSLLVPEKPLNPKFDGVSPDGKNVLYHNSHDGHTMYYAALSPLPDTGFFYELNDSNAGNAIWMPGSRSVLILARNVGVVQVDTQTGQSNTVLPLPLGKPGHEMKIGSLTFFRNGFLYFTGGDGPQEGALYRVQLNSDAFNVQQITFRSSGTTYWLSPDGSTVYFANRAGQGGEPGIYAVNSDGTNSRLLRPYTDGAPIGYAADNSLMIMRYVNGKFQVVKLGASQQQDQVVLADAAPGAVSLCDTAGNDAGLNSICDKDIALSPYGHGLAVQATYADGSHKVWSTDLTTGKQLELQLSAVDALVQLIGWDRLPTP